MSEDGEEGELAGVEAVRDFCLVSPDGVADPHYRIGVLRFISEDDHSENSVQIIFVSVVENKVLCAVPGFAWHRLVRERVLPSGALIRATSVAVASVPEEDREKIEPDCPYIRVWLGFLKPALEDQVSFQNVEGVPAQFVTDDLGEDRIPDAQALFVVADEKYAFVSAESENQQKAGGDNVVETRLNRLEEMLLSLREELRGKPENAAGVGATAKPKVSPPVKAKANQPKTAGKGPVAGLEGLDPHVVKSALQAGVDQDQLAQLARMTGHGGPGRLKDTPGLALPKKFDILGESEEEVAGEEEPAAVEESKDPMTQAVLKLTSIVDALGVGKKKHRSLEELLDSSPPSREGDSSALSFGSSRKHATVLKALKKALVESPNELYASLERRMREDFGSFPIWLLPRLAGASKSSTKHSRDCSSWMGNCRSFRLSMPGASPDFRMQSTLGIDAGTDRSGGGGQRIMVTGGGGVLGGPPAIQQFQPSLATGIQRGSTHTSLGWPLGRSSDESCEGDRRLCGASAEVGTPWQQNSGGRAWRSDKERCGAKEEGKGQGSWRRKKGGGSPKDGSGMSSGEAGVNQPEVVEAFEFPRPEAEFHCKRVSSPGSRASTVHPCTWWFSCFRIAHAFGGSFSQFARSFHRRLAISPGVVNTAVIWPMPLPFPKELGVVSSERSSSEQAALRRGVNFAVLLLNWLHLRRPSTCPAEITIGAGLNKVQWRVVRNLERLMVAWSTMKAVDSAAMGRTATKVEEMEDVLSRLMAFECSSQDWLVEVAPPSSGSSRVRSSVPGLQKAQPCAEVGLFGRSEVVVARPIVADRIEFRDRPSFDPVPYLDEKSKFVYCHPLQAADPPESCPFDPPRVRIHASESER